MRRSLPDAGRTLFASSRQRKRSSNDADRLRKYSSPSSQPEVTENTNSQCQTLIAGSHTFCNSNLVSSVLSAFSCLTFNNLNGSLKNLGSILQHHTGIHVVNIIALEILGPEVIVTSLACIAYAANFTTQSI